MWINAPDIFIPTKLDEILVFVNSQLLCVVLYGFSWWRTLKLVLADVDEAGRIDHGRLVIVDHCDASFIFNPGVCPTDQRLQVGSLLPRKLSNHRVVIRNLLCRWCGEARHTMSFCT